MSDLQDLHEEFGHRGVRVYGLNVPAFGENAETLAAFREQAGLTFAVIDHQGTSYLIDFGGSNGFPYPRDAIVDPTGTIVYTNKNYDALGTRQLILNMMEQHGL